MFPTSIRAAAIPVLIHLLILQSLPCPGAGMNEKKLDIPDVAQGRIFVHNTTSPMAVTFNNNPRMLFLIERLLLFRKQLDKVVQEAITTHRRNTTRKDEHMEICHKKRTTWRSGAEIFIRRHSWSLESPSECVTDVYKIPSGLEIGTEINLRDLMVEKAKIARQLGPIFAAVAARNWTETEKQGKPLFHRHEEGSIKCSVSGSGGLRIGGTWYIPTGYTNGEKTQVLPDFERVYISEFHTIREGKLVAALMRLPVHPNVGSALTISENATTVVEKWSGAATPYWFTNESVKDNLALKEALDQAGEDDGTIKNSLSLSEIGPKILPLVLTLIPVTHYTDKRALKIVFAIMSDIVTAFPLGIKGVELVRIGRKRFVSAVTRIGDPTVGEDTSIAAETWTAECELRSDIIPIGISFIAVSVAMMALGIGIEIAYPGLEAVVRGRGGWEQVKRAVWEHGRRWWQSFYLSVMIRLRRVMEMSDDRGVHRRVDHHE